MWLWIKSLILSDWYILFLTHQPRIFCAWLSLRHHLIMRFIVKDENAPALMVLLIALAGLSAGVDCSGPTLTSLWTEVICCLFERYTLILRLICGAVSISLPLSFSLSVSLTLTRMLKAMCFCGMMYGVGGWKIDSIIPEQPNNPVFWYSAVCLISINKVTDRTIKVDLLYTFYSLLYKMRL